MVIFGLTTKVKFKGGNVSSQIINSAMDTAIINSGKYLLGIVQGIIASRNNTLVVLPGKGEILILPEHNIYHANVPDMVEFCGTSADLFQVDVIGDASHSYAADTGRNLKDLLWQASFHATQGNLIEGCSKYDVVQFRHWPNLTRLPVTPNAARICALLTRYPTTIMLVHRVLGIQKEEVYQIYSAAYCAGIARISNNVARSPELASIEASAATQSEPPQERGLFRSLFSKISGL